MSNSCRQHVRKKLSDSKHVLILAIFLLVLLVGSTAIILAILHIMGASRTIFSPEGAIEMSKTTESVREALSVYKKRGRLEDLTVDVEHWNSSYIKHLKQQKHWKDTSLVRKLPEDHGVWRVHWHEKESDDGVSILQFIDEQTGDVLQEEYAWFG